jgi:orotate phosphoribosyltransferase
MLTQERVLEIFENSGALLNGHFRLRSGLHSARFLQSAVVLQYPEYASALCAELASRVKVDRVDIVLGPAIGGVILAYEVARSLFARAMFGEKSGDGMTLRPGFKIASGDRIVVVDDVLTTGGSVSRLIDLSHQHRAQVVAAAFLIDRSATNIDFGVPKVALARIDIPTYTVESCPMCKEKIPLVEP